MKRVLQILSILLVTAAFAAVFLLPGCKDSGGGGGGKASSGAVAGDSIVAPLFKVTTFDTREFSLQSLKGRPVVINFFASWCPPCRTEAGDLQKAYAAFRADGVEFIGIAIQDEDEDTRDFIREFNWTFPAAPDSTGAVMKAYGVVGVPKTVIIGKDGRILYVHTGAITGEILEREIRKAL